MSAVNVQYFSSYCCFLGSEMFGLLLRKVSEPNVRWINLVTTKREKDFLCNEETIIFIIFLLLQLRFSLINFTNLEFVFAGRHKRGKGKGACKRGPGNSFPPQNTAQYRAILFLKRVLCRWWKFSNWQAACSIMQWA